MKLFIFCIVSGFSLLALPPLPPLPALPPLPSLSAPSVSNSSSAPALSILPAAPAATPAAPAAVVPEEQRLQPIMIDEKGSAAKKINLTANDDGAKKLDDIIKIVSDINQQVSAFQAVEQEIDGLFAGTCKKIDDFLVVVDGFVGQTGGYLDDLQGDFEKKKSELNASLTPDCSAEVKKVVADALKVIDDAKAPVEELKKLLTSARDGRSAIAREEDSVRQKVVDFKKSSVDLAAFYARSVTAKNGLLVGGGDAAAVLSQCTESSKKAQEMVDSLKTKDGQSIRDSFKKLDGMLASGNDTEKVIEKKLSDLKKMVASYSSLEDSLLLAQQADLIKKKNIVLPKKDDANGQPAKQAAKEKTPLDLSSKDGVVADSDVEDKHEPVLGVRENMFQEVVLTVQQGTLLLVDKVKSGFDYVVVMVKDLIAKYVSRSAVDEKSEELPKKVANESSSSAVSVVVAAEKIEKPKSDEVSRSAQGAGSADSSPLISSINKLADSIVSEHELKKDVAVSLPAMPSLPVLPPVPKPV